MFKNYFKSAIRNHLKNKWTSLINIFSLAIGIACCILIFVFVSHEISFDRFHENGDDIYRIYQKIQLINYDVDEFYPILHPHSFVQTLQEELPAIERASSYQQTRILVEYNGKKIDGQAFAKVDPDFLSMFSFPLIVGDPKTALRSHDQIIISENIVRRFFDNSADYSDIIGKVMSFYSGQSKHDYIISGILKSVPKNSSLQFDMLMLNENNNFYGRSSNAFGDVAVYIQLKDGAQQQDVLASLQALIPKTYGKPIEYLRENKIMRDSGDAFTLHLQPLSDQYFNTTIDSRYITRSNRSYSLILSGIGLLILILACINFINLSIGQSLNRTSEIGIRKVLGAARKHIIFQHSLEKLILILFALILGYTLSELLLPLFNQLARKDLTISVLSDSGVPLFLFTILILSSLFAAGIPAILLSKLQPSGVFRAMTKMGGKNRINSILIVIQFFLSIGLLSSAIIMSRQITFIQKKDLGFSKDQVLVIPILRKYSDIYKQKITALPNVIDVSGTDRNFTNGNSSRMYYTDSGKPVQVYIVRVEETYLNTMGMTLVDGRNFSNEFPTDKINSVIVNETFVKEFGLVNPVGSMLNGHNLEEEAPQIIGIINDFHYRPLHEKIKPIILHMSSEINGGWSLMVKIRSDDIAGAIASLKQTWTETISEREFQYSFLDENLDENYINEQRWRKITGIATLIAFIISSLGLLGLALMTINLRIKEIGIRKVLGASVPGVVATLAKDILKWILIANLLAWPVTWFIMNRWLQNYAYHINIQVWTFLLAGFVGLIIAGITVSFQVIRTANANPVKSLRYE